MRCAETGPSKRLGQKKSGSDGTAGFFNLFTGRGADLRALDGEFAGEIASAEDFDGIASATNESAVTQRGFVDDGTILEGIIEFTHIHDFKHVFERLVVEAFLGETAMHRHLATFKAWADTATCACHLALVAFTGGFAVAGAFAAADALAALLGTGAGFDVLELHED